MHSAPPPLTPHSSKHGHKTQPFSIRALLLLWFVLTLVSAYEQLAGVLSAWAGWAAVLIPNVLTQYYWRQRQRHGAATTVLGLVVLSLIKFSLIALLLTLFATLFRAQMIWYTLLLGIALAAYAPVLIALIQSASRRNVRVVL